MPIVAVVYVIGGEHVRPTDRAAAAAAGREVDPSRAIRLPPVTRFAGAHRPGPDGHLGRVSPEFGRQTVRPAGCGRRRVTTTRRRSRGASVRRSLQPQNPGPAHDTPQR